MQRCAICNEPIQAQHNTFEHIIPQSIGGRRSVSGFICRSCNSESGRTWDTDLFQQLQWFTVMLGMERPNGPAPDIKVNTLNGQSYRLSASGETRKLKPQVKRSGDGKSFAVEARDVHEARKLLRQIHEKFPTFDPEAVLANAAFASSPVDDAIKTTFEFGGDLAGRSIVKTAMALAFSLGIPSSQCDFAMRYLRYDANVEPSLAEYFASEIVLARPRWLFNCAALLGDPSAGRLTGYVEYFGVCRWLVHLSTKYTGPAVRGCYAFDAISGEEISLDVDLNISHEDFRRSLTNDSADHAKRLEAYHAALPIVFARRGKLGRSATIEHVMARVQASMGLTPDSSLSTTELQEYVSKVSQYVAEELIKQRAR